MSRIASDVVDLKSKFIEYTKNDTINNTTFSKQFYNLESRLSAIERKLASYERQIHDLKPQLADIKKSTEGSNALDQVMDKKLDRRFRRVEDDCEKILRVLENR